MQLLLPLPRWLPWLLLPQMSEPDSHCGVKQSGLSLAEPARRSNSEAASSPPCGGQASAPGGQASPGTRAERRVATPLPPGMLLSIALCCWGGMGGLRLWPPHSQWRLPNT
jgi:hypothetical protein